MAVTNLGSCLRYEGTGVNDNDVLFTTGDLTDRSAFMLMSTAGAADVFVTFDGTNWSTAPLSLQDFGAANNDPALVTVAGRVYAFAGKFKGIRVLQNGATAATASLMCWTFGRQ